MTLRLCVYPCESRRSFYTLHHMCKKSNVERVVCQFRRMLYMYNFFNSAYQSPSLEDRRKGKQDSKTIPHKEGR